MIEAEEIMVLLSLALFLSFCYLGWRILKRFRKVSKWREFIMVAIDEVEKQFISNNITKKDEEIDEKRAYKEKDLLTN